MAERKRVRSDKEKARNIEYKRIHLKQFNFKLNKEKDADIIAIYENLPDKTAFIREALYRYAAENNIKTEG